MNPVFPAFAQAMMKSMALTAMGIPHTPQPRRPVEEGGAFKASETKESNQ